MIDWEDLATRQINKIPRALPEPIRARATEVPVFFSPARDELGHYFGWDEGQIAKTKKSQVTSPRSIPPK